MPKLDFSIYQHLVDSAESGNRIDARKLCELLGQNMLKPDFILDTKTTEFLAKALVAIGQGQDANTAFYLTRSGPIPQSVEDEINIAKAIYFENRQTGKSIERICLDWSESENFPQKSETLRKCYQRWIKGLRGHYENTI